MQLCQLLELDNHYWKLPDQYNLRDALEDRRRRFTITRRRETGAAPTEEYWKFGRRSGSAVPVFGSTVGGVTTGMSALSLN